MACQGIAIVNFGPLPGSTFTSVFVPAPPGMTSWSPTVGGMKSLGDSTVDHTPDEHLVEALQPYADNITAAGFTMNCISPTLVYGQFVIRWNWM